MNENENERLKSACCDAECNLDMKTWRWSCSKCGRAVVS